MLLTTQIPILAETGAVSGVGIYGEGTTFLPIFERRENAPNFPKREFLVALVKNAESRHKGTKILEELLPHVPENWVSGRYGRIVPLGTPHGGPERVKSLISF